MKVIFRTTTKFLKRVRSDLHRGHEFAHERVGFITVTAAKGHENLLLIAEDYHPVLDDDYVDDPSVGAMMGQEAIRKALDIALLQKVGVFHVHMHGHKGNPHFSKVDLREQFKFVPDFFKVRPEMPHGALVFSRDFTAGRVWLSPRAVTDISEFNYIGPRTLIDRIKAAFRIDVPA